jgi:adenylate kinase family enzyme
MTEPTLVVIRGNSGSGKTTTAREVRRRYGRGCALLEQDYLRRIMLREHDTSGTNLVAPAFITATARNALDLGYHVVLEGILHTDRYANVLHQLIDQHSGPSHVYYLNVSFDETVRRHQTRAETVNFTPEQMRSWYEHEDLLGTAGEQVIGETFTFEQTVETILKTSGLVIVPPLTPCPVRCPRCACKDDAAP